MSFAFRDDLAHLAGPASVLHFLEPEPYKVGWFCPVCRCIVTWVNTLRDGLGGWEHRLERQIVKHEFYLHSIPIAGNMP